MNEETYNLVLTLVRIAAILIATYLIPWITKTVKNSKIYPTIKRAVYATQQVCWEDSGKDRKKFCMQLAREMLDKIGIEIEDGQLSSLIEAAVMEMNIAKGKYMEAKDGNTKAAE